MGTSDTQSLLQEYFLRAFPTKLDAQVGPLTRVATGWESDVYAFDVEHGPSVMRQQEALVLRIYPGNDAYEKSGREYNGMRLLHQAGYPVPEVFTLERENSPFGKPFVIMERIDGQSMWGAMFNGPKERQRRLLELFCKLFLQLHTLDLSRFVEENGGARLAEPGSLIPPQPGSSLYMPADPYQYIDNYLGQVRYYLEQFPAADFNPVLDWLQKRRDTVPCQYSSLIHWDFHPENILLRQDGAAFVIDWTGIQISDPRFDLGWTRLLVGTYENEKRREAILAEYERQAGKKVEGIAYFDVAACVRRLGSVIISMMAGAEQVGMRPGAEAIMRGQLPQLQAVYERMVSLTGIRVAQVEGLFK